MKHSFLRIIVALLLGAAVLLSLIACGDNEDAVPPPSDTDTGTSLPNTPDNGQTSDNSTPSDGDNTGDSTGDNTQSGEETPPSSEITEGEDTNEGGFGEFVPFD